MAAISAMSSYKMKSQDDLVSARQAGHLLEAIENAFSSDPNEQEALASDLTKLHNQGKIDLIDAFFGLRRTSDSGRDFFLLRHVLEEVLPELEAPVPETCRCVLSLFREAGPDVAAGTILEPFQKFCVKDPERVKAALKEIEAAPTDLGDLLVPILVAGSRIDPASYTTDTIRLARHSNLELRRRALFAIGHLERHGAAVSEDAVAVLEETVQHESDDNTLASVVRSASAVMVGIEENDEANARFVSLVSEALSRGGAVALHAASDVFGFQTSRISRELLAVFLERLAKVEVSNTGTLNNLDYGVARLLQGKDLSGGLAFLENILLAHPNDLDLDTFDDAARTIRDSPDLRNKVATRWLLTGEPPLCAAVEAIVDSRLGEAREFQADAGEIAAAESRQLLFAARKAVGYLFQKPVAATSFLLSLLRLRSSDSELRAELEALLFSPLLINFSGKVADYLTARVDSEEEPLKSTIRRPLEALERYLNDLKAVGDIPSLHPSLEHREAHRRYIAGEMARSFKKAQEDSMFLRLLPRSVLLYGRKAVHHAFSPEGEIKRTETHLGAHGTEIKVPRLAIIDPHGLDYMLRAFRLERMAS